MPRFFVDVKDENNISIVGDDARHIAKSLRMKTGEKITVTCKGTDYFCKIKNVSDSAVTLDLIEKEVCQSEPTVKVTLFQALPKGDKFKTIIQKSVELGVSEIVPVLTRRCVARPTEKDFAKKSERLDKISESASKQSGRGIIPKISQLVNIDKAIDIMQENDVNFILYENGGQKFIEQNFENVKSIGVFVGSEGGFDQEEVDKITSAGAIPIWLGKRILRCETAPLAALSIIMNLTGNM
jgi:16S rRNA (uracil1498-N3)-methyltransferase